mmetsp:Transcript_38145/g.105083  ORF Transcript_38145/g.105083 Transcript_38145/m.105083 type:complete len:242 (+) Transcript_38145:366-1091(+)
MPIPGFNFPCGHWRTILINVRIKILIENHEVVALRPKLVESIMPAQETEQLGRGTVVAEMCRRRLFSFEHRIEELPSMPSTLAPFVDIEVEGAQWLDLTESPLHIGKPFPTRGGGGALHEETFFANLQEAKSHVPIHQEIDPLIAESGRRAKRHRPAQSLCYRRTLPQFLQDSTELASSSTAERSFVDISDARALTLGRRPDACCEVEGELHGIHRPSKAIWDTARSRWSSTKATKPKSCS